MAKTKAKKKPVKEKNDKGVGRFFKWQLLILFAVPFLLYIQTAGFGYSYHDDDVMLLERGATLMNFSLKDFFTTDAWLRKAEIELYRPWQTITYAFDYRIAGTEPYIYHLHSVIIYSLSIVLLFFFLQQFNFSVFASFILALFYSVHYLMSHAACWIPARGDVYLVLFALATLLLWFRWIQQRKIYLLAGALLFFILALFSKESAILLLPLMALYLVLFHSSAVRSIQTWWWVVPFAAASVVYLQLRKQSVADVNAVSIEAILYNLPTVPEEFFKFFVPLFYSVMPVFKTIPTLAGTALMVLMAAIIIWRRKETDMKVIAIGAAFFLLPLLPSLFYKPIFVNLTYDYLDHRMFLCGIGLLIISGELLKGILATENKKVQIALFAVIGLSAGLTFIYANAYKDYHSYYKNALQTNPGSVLAMGNYANQLYMQEKKYDEAIRLLDRVIARQPDSIFFYHKKASFAYMQQDSNTLKETSATMLAKWPGKHEGYFMQGCYALLTADFGRAVSYFTQVNELYPGMSDSYFNRALAFMGIADRNNALADLTTSIQLNPQFANAYYQRGNIYAGTGQLADALKDFNIYVALAPNEPQGYFCRGQAYCALGNTATGCADLRKAKQLGAINIDNLIQRFCN